MSRRHSLSFLRNVGLVSPKRCMVVDAGSHSIKLLLAERRGLAVRLLKARLIPVREEGLVSPEEIRSFVKNIALEWGDYPTALVLPAHLASSQIVDAAASGAQGVQQLIEMETLKGRGGKDNALVYNCIPLQPFGRHKNPFWVTLCKENEISDQIQRLSLDGEDICEVLSPVNVLAAAWRLQSPGDDPVALVDFGATNTTITLMVKGQAVHACAFPIGGNLVTETIANARQLSVEAAESLKHDQNLFDGSHAVPALSPVMES